MKYMSYTLGIALLGTLAACNAPAEKSTQEEPQVTNEAEEFNYFVEQFADLHIIRYQIPGWEQLSVSQKKLVYYLTQAGYEGRDIIWDQNYRHNLAIRGALENIVRNYNGDKNTPDWEAFMVYTKRVWFSSGIHHHYSMNKFEPGFSEEYFRQLMEDTETSLSDEVVRVLFDPELDAKKVSLDPNKDLLLASAVNFYGPDVTEAEAEAYYKAIAAQGDQERPVSHGINTRVVRGDDGQLREDVWKVGGLYGAAIERVVYWLEKAVEVAENPAQAEALKLLVQYYQTGDLKLWDDYNIAWTKATEGDIDYINGFVEVYNDPMGYKGSYETIVQIKDFDASERMQVVSENVQWFEDQSPIQEEHKKKNVTGVTYKVVNVAGEAGDASPSTPIGVNLPNANWIRAEHGSKSVSLGNIIYAYDQSSQGGYLKEFALTEEEVQRGTEHGALAGKLHTALHEVVGHASGQLNPGVGTPKETLKNYSSTLEEARADLVSLYYIVDPKIIELGLTETLDVGKAEYESYIRNGLMVQLRRIEPGEVIEESHMRNRQLVAAWAYEKGKAENVIERLQQDGKTYFRINDYEKLRELFGQLLREIQRIKSEGDYEAGRELVETYGVQVDAELHREVLERSEALNIAPYGGFINPKLVPVMEGDQITDIRVEYPADFTEQMLYYSETYNNL